MCATGKTLRPRSILMNGCRMVQSDANCSPGQIPCLTGKEQGTIGFGGSKPKDGQKSPALLHDFTQSPDIPYLQEQGTFHQYQGTFPHYQENFGN